jgi:hypothetical protein
MAPRGGIDFDNLSQSSRIDRELKASAADEAAGNLADFDRTAAELSFQRK